MQENILSVILFSIFALTFICIIPIYWRKYGLLLVNIIFYYICDPKFLLLILFGISWSFLIARIINKAVKYRMIWLFIGIIPVLLTLCFFKYYKFFIPDNSIFLSLAMPLGISYYTFKIISYLVDVYKKKLSRNSFIDYSIYISFFPQIICGPISRYDELSKNLNDLAKPSPHLLTQGCYFILSGLFKKLVIADRLSGYVNIIFSNHSNYPALALWMAAFFFTIQIYCDFAGYSEIAIGISNLFGLECRLNFDKPYFSYSIKDFWRKWHISLSSWLRDYIYIPLGGNRKGLFIKNFNIIITFFISGLWHGTGVHFICWGLWHGFFNLISCKKFHSVSKQFLQIFITFFIVMFGWILFKADSMTSAIQYIMSMFYPFSLNIDTIISAVMPFTGDYSCLSYFITVCLFILLLFIMELHDYKETVHNTAGVSKKRIIIYIISVIFFGMIGQNTFLYANF